MKYKLLILFVWITQNTSAQSNLSQTWMIGDFGLKAKFSNSLIITNQNPLLNLYFHKGHSNICDISGNLLLSSDGFNIYDSLGNYILGGDTLVPLDYFNFQNGWSASSQSSIFLPFHQNKYYFITPSMSDLRYFDCKNQGGSCFFDLLLYNILDMAANNGNGAVTKRMQPLMKNASLSKTQMMACRHANGKDWWLLKQGGDSNIVYKFLFTQDSVYNMGSQYFTSPMWGVWDIKGQSVISRDGTQYATAVQGKNNGEIFTANFDRCSGVLTNPQVIVMPKGSQYQPQDSTITEQIPVGLAYSPNGKLLYAIGKSNIWQYNIALATWYHIAGLDTTYAAFQDYNCSYLGNDDKLYIGNFAGLSKQMSVIDSPSNIGVACSFCPRCLRFDSLTWGYATTPPCMPNYALGVDSSMCWPLANEQLIVNNEQWSIYPNPSNGSFVVEVPEKMIGKTIQVFDIMGKEIFTITANPKNYLNISNYCRGVYFVKVGNEVKRLILE